MQTVSFNETLEYIECALKNLKKSTPCYNIILSIYMRLKKEEEDNV